MNLTSAIMDILARTYRPFTLFRDSFALWVLGISVVLRSIAAASVGPGFDEAYYHAFSLHLAFGYFDHPPLVAITAGLGQWLTGVQHPLTLRLGAVLWATVGFAGLYVLAGKIFDRGAARLALLLPHASPYFFAGAGAFVLPDNALFAAWVWTFVVIYKIRQAEFRRTSGFILLGLITGFALQAKYHAVLIPISLAAASLLWGELRSWWRDWRFYLAIPAALVVFLPCLLWNAANGWVSLAEQFGKSASDGFQVRPDLFGQAIAGQVAYITPWLGIALWIGAFKGMKIKREARWLIAFFIIPVGLFTLLGFLRGVLPHWSMPGYIAAFPLAAGYFATLPKSAWWFILAIIVNLLLVALVIVQAHTGLVPLPEKADPTLDPIGWEETLLWLETNRYLGPQDVIFVHKWFTGGEVAWADPGDHPIVNIGPRPHAFAWWYPPLEYTGWSGVFITQGRYRLSEEEKQDLLQNRFVEASLIEVPEVKRGDDTVSFQVWRVENFFDPPKQDYGPYAME